LPFYPQYHTYAASLQRLHLIWCVGAGFIECLAFAGRFLSFVLNYQWQVGIWWW